MGQEKHTFVEVGKQLKDSCRSKHIKNHSKFEQCQCSGVCVGEQEFWFFRSNAV